MESAESPEEPEDAATPAGMDKMKGMAERVKGATALGMDAVADIPAVIAGKAKEVFETMSKKEWRAAKKTMTKAEKKAAKMVFVPNPSL